MVTMAAFFLDHILAFRVLCAHGLFKLKTARFMRTTERRRWGTMMIRNKEYYFDIHYRQKLDVICFIRQIVVFSCISKDHYREF